MGSFGNRFSVTADGRRCGVATIMAAGFLRLRAAEITATTPSTQGILTEGDYGLD